MSSSMLFTIAGGIFTLMPIGHTQMAFEFLNPGLRSLGAAPAAYASKVSWNQSNGYFITSALMCFKWANDGAVWGMDRYVFAVLMATHILTGLAYLRKGMKEPPLAYWTASILMGIAFTKAH